jgi:putative hemolysin
MKGRTVKDIIAGQNLYSLRRGAMYEHFLNLLLILSLIAVNAFFAASEIAVISVNPNKLKKVTGKGQKKVETLLRFIERPGKFLATIQIGITLAGFLASASASESFSDILSRKLLSAGLTISNAFADAVSVVLVVSLLTFITLVLGELVPKRLALQKSEAISMMAAKPLALLSIVASPIIGLLTGSTNLIVRLLGGNPDDATEKITEEEIRLMVDEGEEKGAIREDERDMIENIFEFDDTPISKVMTYRTGIVAIATSATLEEVLYTVENEGYTRIPVYSGSLDNIIGILHVKDLIPVIKKPENKFSLNDILRPAYFVPESMTTDRLFMKLKEKKNHIAIVVDEYGGTAGLVTMEDLIEEIMGNISDEYDQVEEEIREIDSTTHILSGKIRLDDLQDFLKIKLPVDDYETLNGFLVGQLGRLPHENEKLTIEYEGIVFKIEKVRNRIITRVRTCKL